MDKRQQQPQQRTQSKMERIKRIALELFLTHGPDRVSMDEVAAKADVSKVTIYKYFGSKEELYSAVITLFIDETLAATEAILNSDMDFLAIFKGLLAMQADAAHLVSFERLFQIWDGDNQTARDLNESLQDKVKALLYRFYEKGKDRGYIRDDVSFDTLYLYSEIFRAGMRATFTGSMSPSPLADADALEKLYEVYFFGFINR